MTPGQTARVLRTVAFTADKLCKRVTDINRIITELSDAAASTCDTIANEGNDQP